jgi:1-acyl-sn-glycerol-3-phosphate acyltransferase
MATKTEQRRGRPRRRAGGGSTRGSARGSTPTSGHDAARRRAPAADRPPGAARKRPAGVPLGGLGIPALIGRLSAGWSVEPPNRRLMDAQTRLLWNHLEDRYFRLEIGGWERLPDEPSLLVGVHSGGSLTMDAWTLVAAWWRHFGERRILHGTAHDGLMAAPGLGHYMRLAGVVPARRQAIEAALAAGHDVIIWPGGDIDAMRSWTKRDKVVLGGRKGFVRLAIRQGVPIVPVATVGGHDTVFIVREGKRLAKSTGLKGLTRSERLPVTVGLPFGIALELLPTHLPLPAKIRTELLDPIELDHDPERATDDQYVEQVYRDVEQRIQQGVDRLAAKRRLPVFG